MEAPLESRRDWALFVLGGLVRAVLYYVLVRVLDWTAYGFLVSTLGFRLAEPTHLSLYALVFLGFVAHGLKRNGADRFAWTVGAVALALPLAAWTLR